MCIRDRTFGGILTFCLITQIVTGIILGMHYIAHADLAFESVEHIMRDVNYGWLIRYVHANGASMFFLAVYIHIFRALYYGSYKSPREVIWIIGMIIYFLMIRRPPRSTPKPSSAASDVYKRQP